MSRRSLSETGAKELERIRKGHGGLLRPVHVVESARDEDNPLHSYFEWDDSKAAQRYRLDQARDLIQVVVRVLPNTNTPYRVYVSLQSDRERPMGGYRTTVDVLSDGEMRTEALAMALAELEAVKERYGHLKELADVFAAIDAAAQKIGKRRKAS